MRIQFKFEARNFAEAAAIEEVLKKNNVAYTASEVKSNNRPKLRRKRVTKSELAAVTLAISKQPDWSDTQISKQTNVSSATVGRIRTGEHALQRGNNGN